METYRKSLNSIFLFRMRTATFVMALSIFMLAAGAANAVTYTDSSPQTTEGQNFVFTFSPAEAWSGGNGTLTVHARGDYSIGTSSEYLEWDIEGLVSGRAGPSDGATVIHEFSFNDVEWEQSFTINGGVLNAITLDSSITIFVDLSSAVDFAIDPSTHFVQVELSYNGSGPGCPPPPAPSNPDPCNGASSVPIDTCLAWSDGNAPPPPPPPGTVVINEIYMSSGDWLELFNPTGSPVNLTNWQVITKRGIDTTTLSIPAFTLQPGAYVVLHETAGTNTPTDLYFDQNIWWTESPGSCALVDAGGVGVDFVRWSDSSGTTPSTDMPPAGTNWTGNDPWAPVNQSINTLGRDGVSTDTDNGSDWENTCGIDASSETPGAANIGRVVTNVSTISRELDTDAISASQTPSSATPALAREVNLAGTNIDDNELLDDLGNLIESNAKLSASTFRAAAPLEILIFRPHNNTDSRLAGLGYNVTTTVNAIDLTRANLQGYCALWIGAGVNPSDYASQASDIRDWVSLDGGGLLVVQPNIVGTMVSVFPVGYEVVIFDNWWPGNMDATIVYPSHPVVLGLSDADLSGNADWVRSQDIGSSWDIIAVDAETPSDVALLAGEYGGGRLCFSTGNFSFSSGDPGSDQFVIQMVDWLCSGQAAPPCTATWDVYLGTDPGAMGLVANNLADPNYCPPGGLETGETYFWQAIAKNPSGETPGNVWSFETEGGDPPNCHLAVPSVTEIWPPRHEWVDIEILDVNDPDGDPVTITITGITQDEPVAGHGSGKTSPDGMGVGTSVAHVRAERSGLSGNGRVYEISFEADDGTRNTCNGSVKVCVPHDQGHESVDDGQLYDSTATEMFSTDLNSDGIINMLDFNILLKHWLVSYELED